MSGAIPKYSSKMAGAIPKYECDLAADWDGTSAADWNGTRLGLHQH